MKARIGLGMVLLAALVGCGRDFEMPEAPTNVSLDGTCLVDSDCSAALACKGALGEFRGVCTVPSQDAVLLRGDLHALDYRDNLPYLWAYIEASYGLGPPELLMINGSGLRPDATVDLGGSPVGNWNYQFRLSASSGRYVSVVYYVLPTAPDLAIGIVNESGGSATLVGMSEADVAGFLAPEVLLAQFADSPDCDPVAGRPGDTFLIMGMGPPQVFLDNALGESFDGDPTTGLGTVTCNP